MNKISNISDSVKIIHQKNNFNNDQTNLFEKTFQNALENKQISDPTGNSNKSLGEIRTETFNNITLHENISENYIAKKTDSLLNLLDDYSKALANPLKNLKEIAPLISNIKESAQNLAKEAHSMTENNNLKDIATKCAFTANVEYIKFARGDYI